MTTLLRARYNLCRVAEYATHRWVIHSRLGIQDMGGYEGSVIHKSHDRLGKIVVAQRNLVRSLYFDTPCKQSSASLLHPAVLVLEYTQVMMSSLLLVPSPQSVLLVGLGGGSIAKFLLHYFPEIQIDVVELREKVVKVAHGYFNLPENDPRLRIHVGEGSTFIREACFQSAESYDLVLLDAFTDAGPSDTVADVQLVERCKRLLTRKGVLVINLWNRPRDRFPKVWRAIREAYDGQVLRLALGSTNSNVVVLASKTGLPILSSDEIKQRARNYEMRFGLNFPSMLRLLDHQNRPLLARLLHL